MDYIELHEYKLDADGKHRLRLGDVFKDVTHFRYVLNEAMVKKGFDIKRIYNEPRRSTTTCKVEDCPWYVNVGKVNKKTGIVIKELHKKHYCRQTGKSVAVSTRWMAEKIQSKVAIDPHVKVSILKTFMHETYGLKLEKLKLYRARERARLEITGDHSKSYEKFFQYAAMIHKCNPRAICKVLCDTQTKPDKVLFQRFFVAFPAKRNAFHNGCRPFIGLDGCHLKGKFGGLLAAVGIDANNGMIPLALCVCEIENTETWSWFLDILHSYLDDGRQITFCTDRQKGLLGVLETTWPIAYHRPCARHIYANFSKDHPGVILRNLF